MVADVSHGLRSKNPWFPCKYFTLNAFSLSVIAVDLSGSVPGEVDQVAKLGSMAFMCTMIANLTPSLAAMDNNELLTNITALGVLVITLVVNVCIQIQTGIVASNERDIHIKSEIVYELASSFAIIPNSAMAVIYVIMLLLLLIIQVCSSLMILRSKQIIESKYQQRHETASEDLQRLTRNQLTIEMLQKHVSNYWIMARSGSPQFIITCSATSIASGTICNITTTLHTLTMFRSIDAMLDKDYGSDYNWSTLLILIVQFIGVEHGTIAPLCRCVKTLIFRMPKERISNQIKAFKVESYWTQKLHDWKRGNIRFPFRNRKVKVAIMNLKSLVLNSSIKIQEGVVVVCKIIGLISFFLVICIWYFQCCSRWLLQAMYSSSGIRTENLEQSSYVLQLENELELAERTLKHLSNSMNRLIGKGEKKQPNNLKKLILEKSTKGFQGVKKFDSHDDHVHSSPSKGEYRHCWSLPVVTLTTIAVSLPNIEHVERESLMKSVREGFEHITLVEENLNAIEDYVISQKASETLWQEVDVCRKWLGDELDNIASQVNIVAASQVDPMLQIVQLFLEKAKNKINEGLETADDDSKFTSCCANSMYRITETIINEKGSHERLFDELSSRIADIMAACLTNLPQVIAMKCHTSAIEKREACVEAAVQLLGETKEIINTVQDCDVPNMNPDDFPFIDKWRVCL